MTSVNKKKNTGIKKVKKGESVIRSVFHNNLSDLQK